MAKNTQAEAGGQPSGDAMGFQKVAFAAIVFSHAVNDMSGAFFASLAPLIAKEFGLSLTTIGLIMSIRSITGSMPQPLFGWLSDRFPSRWWLISTPIGVGIGRTMIGFATGFWSLAAMLSTGALFSACYHPAAAAMAGKISAARRGLVVSAYIASGRMGHAAGPFIALTLVSLFGLKGLSVGMVFYFASVAVLMRYVPRDAERKKESQPDEAPAPLARDLWRPMALLYLIMIFRNVVTINLYGFLPLYYSARGDTLWEGGTALTLFLVAGASGGVVGGWLSDRIGRKRVIVFSALAVAPLLLVFLGTGGLLQYALILPLGVFMHASMGVSVAYAQEFMPNRPALAASIMQGGNWFVSGLTLTGTGALGDWLGIDAALQLLAAILVLEFAISLTLPGRGKEAG
jgi:FSR family fosmidomycin resistance protein-like MFS transporter